EKKLDEIGENEISKYQIKELEILNTRSLERGDFIMSKRNNDPNKTKLLEQFNELKEKARRKIEQEQGSLNITNRDVDNAVAKGFERKMKEEDKRDIQILVNDNGEIRVNEKVNLLTNNIEALNEIKEKHFGNEDLDIGFEAKRGTLAKDFTDVEFKAP